MSYVDMSASTMGRLQKNLFLKEYGSSDEIEMTTE